MTTKKSMPPDIFRGSNVHNNQQRSTMNHGSLLLLPLLFLVPGLLSAQVIDLELSLGFERFEQQVKQEIGGAQGERLVEESRFSVGLAVAYGLNDYLGVGAFVRMDVGSSSAGRFVGFDSNGAAVVGSEIGGSFSEVWFGPMVRGTWRSLHLDLGYGLTGLRSDDARGDLPSTTGDTTGIFSTSPSVAWLIAFGGAVPIKDNVDLVVSAEYRVRYYTERGGDAIVGDIEHGTQSLVPLIGVRVGL